MKKEIERKIVFFIPPRRESVRLNLSVSEEMYKKLKIIQFKHECTMAQVIEMLVTASIPEYFEQFPVKDGEAQELFMLSEGEKQRMCKNPDCKNPYTYHKQKEMTDVKGQLWCSDCIDGNRLCNFCSKKIEEKEEMVDTENLNGFAEYYHKACYAKQLDQS